MKLPVDLIPALGARPNGPDDQATERRRHPKGWLPPMTNVLDLDRWRPSSVGFDAVVLLRRVPVSAMAITRADVVVSLTAVHGRPDLEATTHGHGSCRWRPGQGMVISMVRSLSLSGCWMLTQARRLFVGSK